MKLPFQNDQKSTAATAGIVTFEGLLTYIADSEARMKEEAKTNVGFENHVDGGDDVDADINVHGDTRGGDEVEYNVSIVGLHYQLETSDNYPQSSELSFSSTATMDGSISAARTMDKYHYQPTGRFAERLLMVIAFLIHIGRGEGVHLPFVPVPVSDGASVSTVSNASTITDGPGTGRTVDEYIYQVLDRMLERCGGRIAMSTYLSAATIRERIEEVWLDVEIKEPCYVCQAASVREMSVEEKVRMAVSRVEDAPSGAFIFSGIKELTKRLR